MIVACPCGLKTPFSECCEPYLSGDKVPETAEILMRSRYVAYTLERIDYVEATHAQQTRDKFDVGVAESWARKADWIGLEIIKTDKGQHDDVRGLVEFKAHFRINDKRDIHHEISEFVRQDEHWVYLDGRMPEIGQMKNERPKIGRNDPCYCGKGLKYKKCCGISASI